MLRFRPWPPIIRGQSDAVPSVALFSVSPNSSDLAGGSTATLIGTGFRVLGDGTQPTVMFGAFAATDVTVVDAQTITCTIPAGAAGIVDVTVTIQNQAATLEDAFTFYETTITLVRPSYAPASGGTEVQIYGSNFVTGSTVTFGGTPATGVIFLDDQHIRALVPNHALGFVDVVVTPPTGSPVTLRGGFQYTLLTRGEDIRRLPGVSIQEALGNTPKTATFTVDGQSNPPTPGEKIEIMDGVIKIFAGIVINVKMRYEGQIDQLVWDVQCVDFTWLLNKRRPTGFYDQISASEIVTDLVTKFAPGFTTNHVQTTLAKITILFDGADDFGTCLTRIGQAIGSGHWRVDYDQDVHFFHKLPPSMALPEIPVITAISPMQTSLSSAIVATAIVGGNYSVPLDTDPETGDFVTGKIGWVQFAYSFLYDNGYETPLSSLSVPIAGITGVTYFQLDNIATGPAIGTLTCVGVRLYTRYLGGNKLGSLSWLNFIADQLNGTSSVQWKPGLSDLPAVAGHTPTSFTRKTNPPVGPAYGPSFYDTTLAERIPIDYAYVNIIKRTGGNFAYALAAVYPDGTRSKLGPSSAVYARLSRNTTGFTTSRTGGLFGGIAFPALQLFNLAPGATINGQAPIYREIWEARNGVWIPENMACVGLVPNNTSTSTFWTPALMAVLDTASLPTGRTISAIAPVWPNDDGPDLENDVPPDDIDDDNEDLLHADSGSQPFEVETDTTQLCNRLYVKGKSAALTQPAFEGDVVLHLASVTLPGFHPGGGKVYTPQGVLQYQAIIDSDDPQMLLAQPLLQSMEAGTPVNLFLVAENKASQTALGKVEFDKDGNPTDGVHEAFVSDDSLETWIDVYTKAFATLEQFAYPIVTIRYATRSSKVGAGKTQHVDLTYPPCQGDFLIQEVMKDQVHDESDQIGARYTVTASSVRFNLEDYLLQLGQAPPPGATVPSLKGLAGVDFSDSTSSVGSFNVLDNFMGYFAYSAYNATNGAWTLLAGSPANSFNGTPSTVLDTRAVWRRMTSSAVIGQKAGIVTSGTFVRAEHNPKWQLYIRTGPSVNLSNIRMWILLGATDGADAATPGSKSYGLRYDSASTNGDTGFTLYAFDGTTISFSTFTPTPIRPSTEYDIKIETLAAGASFQVTINGVVAGSMDIPSSILGTDLSPGATIYTHDAVAKFFDVARAGYQSGLF